MKQTLKIILIIVSGIVGLLILFSGVWNLIVKSHLQQLNEAVLSQSAQDAAQEALAEKAAYQAAEFRAKRLREEARNQYAIEKLRLQSEMLPRYTQLKFYGAVGVLSIIGISFIILSGGYARAKIREASVCMARIGKHSEIPVHYHDLQNFYPIAVNLSLAEIQASVSTSHDNAYRISRQMIEDISNYTRAIAGKRGMLFSGDGQSEPLQTALAAGSTVPTFAELLQQERIGPDKPLIMGFSQGQPQYRVPKDMKSLAVAGWQGSGKTLSMAYIVAASVLAYRMQVYVIDPHKNHHESLYALLQPLESSGYVSVVNPFDTPRLLKTLHACLDRRLNGQEACTPGILLVIDELARLAKMECFNLLLAFLERCTEETRKANITFIGGSHKWTARHFNGRADIRRCMNSMLIHKTKPSQANLLIEDSAGKNLVKHIRKPGDAILATDYDEPQLISVPLCTREDMKNVAKLLNTSKKTTDPKDMIGGEFGRFSIAGGSGAQKLHVAANA